MPQLAAVYGLHRDALADMPRAELDEHLWQLPDALNGWR